MASPVYYSVCPYGTGDIKTGSPTLTMSSGVATLSVSQTGNIGVGCRVSYNSGSVAYIAAVNSATSFDLVTATGGTPGDEASPVTVDSIAHEYASMATYEAGFTDASHINNTDLTVAGADVVAYCPCYYDHDNDTIDSTICSWAGQTTGAANYIQVYTPQGGTESINSQRHNGTWSSNAYRIAASGFDYVIDIYVLYIRLNGLQVENTHETNGDGITLNGSLTETTSSHIECTDNVVRDCQEYGLSFGLAVNNYIWNNIVYGCDTGIQVYRYTETSPEWIVYSNTVWNCTTYGIYTYHKVVAKNNCVQDCGTCYATGSSWHADTEYNCSDDSTEPGANGQDGEVTFVSEVTPDLHLAAGDTVAKSNGTDLSTDPDGYLSFADDIDGDTRSLWSMGADDGVVGGFAGRNCILSGGILG